MLLLLLPPRCLFPYFMPPSRVANESEDVSCVSFDVIAVPSASFIGSVASSRCRRELLYYSKQCPLRDPSLSDRYSSSLNILLRAPNFFFFLPPASLPMMSVSIVP